MQRPPRPWLWRALARSIAGLCLAASASWWAPDAAGQRPFPIDDPFYQDERAFRSFFDGFALSAEVSYRTSGAVQDGELFGLRPDPLGLSFRFDYQLARQVDVSAILDAAGRNGTRSLSVSWLVLTYYGYVEDADYAFRIAVDPATSGRLGFPQIDAAFLSSRLLSKNAYNDLAVGLRRVRLGYAEQVSGEELERLGHVVEADASGTAYLYTRALGTELHVMTSYRILFDPSESGVTVTFQGEGGWYDLVEAPLRAADATPSEERTQTKYRGLTLWMRSSLALSRPSYQIAPFLSIPLQQWISDEAQGPRSRLHAGVQLMLR